MQPLRLWRLKASPQNLTMNRFGEAFVKTGKVDRRFGKQLRQSFDLRQASDYSLYAEIDQGEADEVVSWAQGFIQEIKRLLDVL